MALRTALALGAALLAAADTAPLVVDGGVVRGPRDAKRVALEFTGHEFAEGAGTILDALQARGAKASFFLTGDFVRRPEFAQIIARIRDEGHYLGPHSDRHLLYCDWTAGKPTLVTREAFRRDVEDNLHAIERHGIDCATVRYWVPAYEHYNPEIAAWSAGMGLRLINFTPGTRSNADYTGEADANFVASETIVTNILDRERADPDGLNGFLLLLHIGAGPGRRDKMHDRLGGLLDELKARGYAFVRVDTLLDGR
jgi:peptidoglycan/xylan/chitin deacetylase (PgdA/CDA1 family)